MSTVWENQDRFACVAEIHRLEQVVYELQFENRMLKAELVKDEEVSDEDAAA